MKALILCAGKGERLLPLTKDIPKPMIEINNKPVLEYLVKLCKKHGINEIAINTSYLPEKIKEYFGDGSKFGVKIIYSFEEELLGTAGALNNFRDFFNETFFVIYGDNVTDLNLTKMLAFHKTKGGIGVIYLYKEPIVDEKTTPGCVVLGNNQEVKEIIERPNSKQIEELKNINSEKKLTNAGVYIFEPNILNLIPKGVSDFSREILPIALKSHHVYGFDYLCYFKEVGQLIRYKIAKEDIESGKIKFDFI